MPPDPSRIRLGLSPRAHDPPGSPVGDGKDIMDQRERNTRDGISRMLSRAWHRRTKSSRNGFIRPGALGTVILLAGVASLAGLCVMLNRPSGASEDAAAATADRQRAQKMLREYFEQMSAPKPLVVRRGPDWESRRRQLREKVLEITGLEPLPKRVPLDVRQSAPLDHPWCTVRRVYYQLWPGVYSSGLLFMPKQFRERPAPAMLSPHGHWQSGNAHPEVQRRCLNFARLGYVTFSSTQNHYEDLSIGVSHQTLMMWNNIRALDYLESLPEVDKKKIGVAGASGGGLQTEMLVALDDRVKAATIVGLTCDFREIMFSHTSHCVCNHFPGVMRLTDHPEISTLGLPAPVQYLTMDDWTKKFQKQNFPAIQQLYAAHGFADRVFCKYFETPHSYDQQKREHTYWWMERWVRGRRDAKVESEPQTKTFPIETLVKLSTEVPGNKGFAEISRIYEERRGYKAPAISTAADWESYCRRMIPALEHLLGEDAALPRQATATSGSTRSEGSRVLQRVGYPSEGGIVVPAIVVRTKKNAGKLPVVVMLGPGAKESLLAEGGPAGARVLAEKGFLVVLPDPRTFGELFATCPDDTNQRQAWERNGIVWGRPVPGMAATDLRGVLDGIASRSDADMSRVQVTARGSGDLAVVALFAAALDRRITGLDVDLAGCCFAKRNLALVSRVLEHGDVLQWAALSARRKLTLRNVPPQAGDKAWLAAAFQAAGNAAGLQTESN